MNKEQHIELLKLMIKSRLADKREAMLIRQGKAHVHASSSGHEALMVVPFLLRKSDYLYPYYRGCHLMRAKGLSCRIIARDFLAKNSSSSQGRSMSAHCGSVEYNIFPGAAPTASQCLPAVGTAWGQKLSKTENITLCSVGDGATREGEFYEAVCQAVQERLPVIFLIEDNQYAISTNTSNLMPFRLDIFDSKLFLKCDGSDVSLLYDNATHAIEKVRSGHGPMILWCEVDRLDSHTAGDDHRVYRLEEELNNLRDPIVIYANSLIQQGYLEQQELDQLWKTTKAEIWAIYTEAEKEPEPQPTNLKHYLYADSAHFKPLQVDIGNSNLTMVEAVNSVLETKLKIDDKLILFGQDIEDPKGGVFGFTKGLSTKYPGRVCNTPVAEATMIGTAVGLAAFGYHPIVEIQFIDFITPGFDQLVTHVSSLRWRSCGQWSCPLVLYAPYGAYLPAGGLWHSQSNEGWWTHIPGVRVAIPSTAHDTWGLFSDACQFQDPSLILIPKHIFRIKTAIKKFERIPFGKARIVKEGEDVTLVGWGNAIELLEKTADALTTQNISAEIIDLRTLVPCDWEAIARSIAKTGRLVMVQEDNLTSSFGTTILTKVVSNLEWFSYLHSAPQLVARDDLHIPYHPTLEYAVLPSIDDVIQAVYRVVEY